MVYGLLVGGNSPARPSNPIIVNNMITDTGRGSNTADGIQVEYNSAPLIKNTVVLRSTEDAIYSLYSTPTLINVTLDGGNFGISSSATGYIYI